MHQAITEYDAAILLCAQPANMAPEHHANVLLAKSCKVAVYYFEGNLNKVSIEGSTILSAIVFVTIGHRTHMQF